MMTRRTIHWIPVLAALACAFALLASGCKKESIALAAKSPVSNGLYPQVTPLCKPNASFGAPVTGTQLLTMTTYGYMGSRYYCSGTGRAYSLSFYLQYEYPASGKETVSVALYRDSGGVPSVLVSKSGTVRVGSGWNELDILDADITPGWYWLMVVGYIAGRIPFEAGPADCGYVHTPWWTRYDFPAVFDLPTSSGYFSNELFTFKVNYCP